jgi:hypothetical protein
MRPALLATSERGFIEVAEDKKEMQKRISSASAPCLERWTSWLKPKAHGSKAS